MSLQIGDWVRVKDGCADYWFTVAGSIGIVSRVGGRVSVDFKKLGPTAPGGDHIHEYDINTEHLEKIDPPAHLVGVGQIVIPPQETTRSKTREEKIEIFSRKIDSEEVFKGCLEEVGIFLNGDSWWQTRDNARIGLGYFKLLARPSAWSTVPQDAYLHLSKCGTKVAFAENEDKQKRDIWTVMGYGRYLTKYHPELDNEMVKKAVNTFNYDHGAAPEVFFGESQDEFIRAINEGPRESCMQGLEYAGHIHPAAAYAAGDIKVAWLERDSRITARTLINKQTKAFSRVYGDHAKLKPLLEAMGYESQVGALAGCRLLMIQNKDGKGYIMPYVDAGVGTGGGALYFREKNGFFLLNDEGIGLCTSVGNDNDGVTESQKSGFLCDDCSEECNEDDLTYTYHETSVCQSCLEEHYTYALIGRNHHEYVKDRRAIYVKCRNEWVHEDYLEELDVVCDDFSGEYIELDDAVQTLSGQWAHANACVECGENKYRDTLYLHKSEVDEAKPGKLYKKGDGYFWHKSAEIKDWLESAGEEDHDPDEFVLVYAKVKPEAPKVEAVLETPTPEPQTTWQAAYLRMQERGIKFVLEGVSGEIRGRCGFSDDRHQYKIDPTQTPPADWEDIYKEAQESGVVFDHLGIDGVWCPCAGWAFDCSFNQYRLKETT